MSSIVVYSKIKDAETLHFTGVIKDNISDIDWKNVIILRGGRRIDENYEVKENDVIFIRKVPAAASSTIAIIVGVVSLVVGGVAFGISLYNQNKAKEQTDAANRAASALGEKTDALPFIRGARNAAATGQTFPYIIGETLFTPYRLCPHHYTISGTKGEKQYINLVFETGFNNLLFKKVKMGETVIKTFSETSPQNGVYTWDNGTFYDAENRIEIRQSDAFSDDNLNKKIIAIDVGKEIPHDYGDNTKWKDGVVQEMPAGTMRAEIIALFDGLRKYDDGWESASITLQPQWTNVNNPQESDWNNFTTGFIQNGTASNTFTYNTKDQMRFVATQNFTAAQAYGKTIKLRVLRTTAKEESNARDSVYFLAAQATIYDDKKSSASSLVAADVLEADKVAKCCRMGVRVIANDNTDGMLDAFSVIVAGVANAWNGSAWTAEKTPTRNLAAWVREIMTSDKHGPSMYTAAELDADSWGIWYEYCATQGFNADGVIYKPTKKRDVLNTLCANGNAALVYNPATGKIDVAIDNGREYPVALLNADTLRNITTTKNIKRTADGVKTSYVNRAADYDTDNVIFMRDGGAYDPATDTLTELALQYVTDYEHAFKISWRKMAEEIAQPNVATASVGREGAYYPLFARVDVEHRTLTQKTANVEIRAVTFVSGLLSKIILAAPVALDSGLIYGIIANVITDTGRAVLPIKVSVNGSGIVKTDTLNVESVIRQSADVVPAAGDYGSIGELDADGEFTKVVRSMKITNCEETDDGYKLTLTDYNAAVYEYGTMPDYKSNITPVPTVNAVPVAEQRENITLGEAQALNSGAAQAAVDAIHGTRFTNVYKLRDNMDTLDEIIAKLDEDARNTSASISMSEDEILLQVADMERELVGLIDIQAGSVSALVAGGGATGQMSLSLQLPVIIDEATREKLIHASSTVSTNAVYGKIDNSDYYGIKSNVSTETIKTLWFAAVEAGLIASQIDLSATQISVNAENIILDGSTIITDGKKIRTEVLEVEKILGENAIFSGTLAAKNGVIENIQITGNSKFYGEIISGPLELLNSAPEGQTKNYSAGTSMTTGTALYNELSVINSYSYSGKIGSINYDRLDYIYTETYVPEIKIPYIDYNPSTGRVETMYTVIPAHYDYVGYLEAFNNGISVYRYDKPDNSTPGFFLPYNLTINYRIGTEAKIFKLKNLPTVQPAERNIVWNDNGTLKIS